MSQRCVRVLHLKFEIPLMLQISHSGKLGPHGLACLGSCCSDGIEFYSFGRLAKSKRFVTKGTKTLEKYLIYA